MAKYLDDNGLLYFWQKIKTLLGGKQDSLTFDSTPTSASTNPVTSGGVYTALGNKQDTLTFDSAPTSASTNPVTSGGVYTALGNKQDTLTFDSSPTASSTNPVTSGGVYTALGGKVDTETGKGLSENDFTDALLTKLNGIAEGATANTGTVTSVTISATSPISIDSSSAITTTGSRTISHANSGVTAGTYKSVTVNATGHVTAGSNPTTLSGYGITDAYTKTEVDTAIGSVVGVSFEIVSTLPTTGDAGTIYLVSNSGTGTNVYDEYIYISNSWEKIGTTDVDLTNYYNTSNLVAITNAEIDTILAA